MQQGISTNTLFYGDNLAIMREYIPDESGREAEAPIKAFEDTWHWSEAAEETCRELISEGRHEVYKAVSVHFGVLTAIASGRATPP